MKFSDFWVVWWKFTKFLVSYLKPQVSFSLNFVSLFNVMRDNCSVLYLLKLYIILAKVTHESPKFQTFNCSHEISPNLYFHTVLLLKVYRISAKKKYREAISPDTEKWCRIWRKLISCFKNDKNLVNFYLNTWNSQNFSFDWLLLCKVYNVWTKKGTEGLSFLTLKSDANFEEELTSGLKNNMRNITNFHHNTLKSQNWDSDGIL